MLSNAVIQADIVADLKAFSSLVSRLKDANEIKEDQYQGTQFAYPAIRIALGRQVPYRVPELCDHMTLTFSIRVYSELTSSMEADEIAGIIANRYHRFFFRGTGWTGYMMRTAVVSAALWTEKLWRAEAFFQVHVYPTTSP